MPVTLLDRAERFLPVETVPDRITFQIIAAGEAQKLRVHVHQHLHQIFAESVRAVVPGRREQRDHTQPDGSGLVECQSKMRPRRGDHLPGFERHFNFFQSVVRPEKVPVAKTV